MRITYNAPVTLTFTLLCLFILLLSTQLGNNVIQTIFTTPGGQRALACFNYKAPLDYIRLFTHVFGHADLKHLISNLSFILILGPFVEKYYGSLRLCIMMMVTALVGGTVNAIFSRGLLIGCGDIAFLMILLHAFATLEHGEIELSNILILLLYIGRELIGYNNASAGGMTIATAAHFLGGVAGSVVSLVGGIQLTTNAEPNAEASKSQEKTIIKENNTAVKEMPTQPHYEGNIGHAYGPQGGQGRIVIPENQDFTISQDYLDSLERL